MANVLLTGKCNRACPFCFATKEIAQRAGRSEGSGALPFMSLDDFDRVIEFLRRSQVREVGLLGGEPTLHPQFPEIMRRSLDAGLHVKLFTGGVISERATTSLEGVDPARLNVVVNLPRRADCTFAGEYERILKTLERLAPVASLGLTIHEPRLDAAEAIDVVLGTRCRRNVRLGLGLPMLDSAVGALPVSLYRSVAQALLAFAAECDRHDIQVGFDCGFSLCMFTPEELGLLRTYNCNAQFLCRPIIDIGTDLDVWTCFPLSQLLKVRLTDFETREHLERYFQAKLEPYRSFGIHDDCTECKHLRRGACGGGCLAHTIRSFDRAPTRALPMAARQTAGSC